LVAERVETAQEVAVARDEAAAALLDVAQRSKPIVFELKEPVGVIERLFLQVGMIGCTGEVPPRGYGAFGLMLSNVGVFSGGNTRNPSHGAILHLISVFFPCRDNGPWSN
jgi:hypothetical protein